MDQTFLLVLAVAAIVAVAAVAVIRSRSGTAATPDGGDARLGVSTEGMKLCPKCGMGNMWTDRTCMSCRAPLRG